VLHVLPTIGTAPAVESLLEILDSPNTKPATSSLLLAALALMHNPDALVVEKVMVSVCDHFIKIFYNYNNNNFIS